MGAHKQSLDRIERLHELGAGPWPIRRLRDAGWSEAHVRQAVRSGRLVRVRKGAVDLPGPRDGSDDGLRGMVAAALEAYPHAVVSHETAARLQGLWLPGPPTRTIHLTAAERPDRVPTGIRVHGSRLSARWIDELDGVPVTAVARTGVDLARGRSIERAVLVLDGAARQILLRQGHDLRPLRDALGLRRRLTEQVRSQLWPAYQSERRWPFTVVVRSAIPLVEPASESPAESRSRVWVGGCDLPEPSIAALVRGASGTAYFADFLWERWGVVGEVDGTSKYGSTDDEVRRSVRSERRRQRDLEDAGYVFARWDAVEPRQLVLARVRRTLRSRGWDPSGPSRSPDRQLPTRFLTVG